MTDRSATTDIVTQIEVACRNPHAALIGALIGGLVPWFGRSLAHGEIQDTWTTNRSLALVMVVVVIGCGCFSGLSVYKFGRSAFNDPSGARVSATISAPSTKRINTSSLPEDQCTLHAGNTVRISMRRATMCRTTPWLVNFTRDLIQDTGSCVPRI